MSRKSPSTSTRRTMVALAAAVATVFLATPAAANDGMFGRYFEQLFQVATSSVCFGRAYDQAHLDTHPRQNVSALSLIVSYHPHGDEIHFQLGVRFRKPRVDLGANGVCEGGSGGYGLRCYVTGMGGELDLSLKPDQPTLLSVPKPVNVWKDADLPQDFNAHGPFGTDDKVFALERWPDEKCATP